MPPSLAYAQRLCAIPTCRKPFTPNRHQKYCSDECYNESQRLWQAANRLKKAAKPPAKISDTIMDAVAPDVLYCPVIYPSLLPYFVADDLYIMTDREYRGLLRAGALDGLYVEVWRWNSKTSQVFRVCGDVAKMVREVRE